MTEFFLSGAVNAAMILEKRFSIPESGLLSRWELQRKLVCYVWEVVVTDFE